MIGRCTLKVSKRKQKMKFQYVKNRKFLKAYPPSILKVCAADKWDRESRMKKITDNKNNTD